MIADVDVVLYAIGVVVGAIGFGFYAKSNGSEFKLIEDGFPLMFLLAFWPIVVAVLCLGAVIAAMGIIPCWVVKQLFNFGRWLGMKYDNWKSARRERKLEQERERQGEIKKNVARMKKALKKRGRKAK